MTHLSAVISFSQAEVAAAVSTNWADGAQCGITVCLAQQPECRNFHPEDGEVLVCKSLVRCFQKWNRRRERVVPSTNWAPAADGASSTRVGLCRTHQTATSTTKGQTRWISKKPSLCPTPSHSAMGNSPADWQRQQAFHQDARMPARGSAGTQLKIIEQASPTHTIKHLGASPLLASVNPHMS